MLLANLIISKSDSKTGWFFKPAPGFWSTTDNETNRKGKHQMFKTLITSVINHNCHKLNLITSGVINTRYIALITSDVIKSTL